MMSAGVVFTDGNLMLCGYQPHKSMPCISGIGGKCEPNEDAFSCAIREMIEELFEIKNNIPGLLWTCKEVSPRTSFVNQNYYIVMYSFDDLERILRALENMGAQSPLYDVFPTCLLDLLFKRKSDYITSEISHLALIPIIEHNLVHPFVDTNLLDDMRTILTRRKEITE